MSYSLHIEREDEKIKEKEWFDFVQASSDLNVVSEVTTQNLQTGEVISVSGANSNLVEANDGTIYRFFEGVISVDGPDEPVITKMKGIALSLRAKVIGDEGEEY